MLARCSSLKKILLLAFLAVLAIAFIPFADARPICIGPVNGGQPGPCVLDAVTVPPEPSASPTPSPTLEPNCGENGQPGKCPEGLVCQPKGITINDGYQCEDPFPTPGPGCPGGCPQGQWCVVDHCENIPPCPASCPNSCEWNGVAMVCGDGSGCSPACAAGYSCRNGGCVRDCTSCAYGCNPDGSCRPAPICPGPTCPPDGDEDDPCYDACYSEPVIQEVCDACRAKQGAGDVSAGARSSESQQRGLLGAFNSIVKGIAPLGQAVKQIVAAVLGVGAGEEKAPPAVVPEPAASAATPVTPAPLQSPDSSATARPAPVVTSQQQAPAFVPHQAEEAYAGKPCSSNAECASACSGGFCWICQPLAQASSDGICVRISSSFQTPVPAATQQPPSSIRIAVPAKSTSPSPAATAAPAAAPAPQPRSVFNQLICGVLTLGGLLGSCPA